MTRLKELRKKFDRLTDVATQFGYTDNLKRQLAQLAKDIKQEEAAQRFAYGQEIKENEKATKPF